MSRAVVVLAVSAVILLAFAYAGSADETDERVLAGMSCNGQETLPTTAMYYFYFNGPDGFCKVTAFQANSYEEAEECANRYCPDCEVKDVTALFRFSSSVPGLNDVKNFCPAVR